MFPGEICRHGREQTFFFLTGGAAVGSEVLTEGAGGRGGGAAAADGYNVHRGRRGKQVL